MKKTLLLLSFMLILAYVLLPGTVKAAETGEQILSKMDQVMKSDSKILEEEMILLTADGQKRERKVKVWNSNSGGKEKMLLRFLAPESVQGTGFMMEGDDMWLYLPALGKVRRIAGHAKKGNFMGSDLSYEDMEAIGNKGFSKDYQVKQFTKITFNQRSAYSLEVVPKNTEVSYSKLLIIVDETLYLPLKIQYYDPSGNHIKTLTTADHRKVGNRWTAHEIQVKDEKKGSTTVLKVTNVQFDVKIDDSIFTTRNLERGN